LRIWELGSGIWDLSPFADGLKHQRPSAVTRSQIPDPNSQIEGYSVFSEEAL